MAGKLLGSFPPNDNPGAFGGVWPSMHDMAVPFVKNARNVVFTASGIKKMDGWVSAFPREGTSAIRGITQIYSNGKNSIFFGTASRLLKYEDDSASATVLNTGFTGINAETTAQAATHWSMLNFGNWVLATNGVDAPKVYKTTSFENLIVSGQFGTAEIFKKSGPYVLAFNLATASGALVDKFAWCHTDDVDQWSANELNAAGAFYLRDFGGEVIAVSNLGDSLSVYGSDCMFLVNFLGAPYFFGANRALSGIGAVSKNSVTVVGRRNYGLSRHGFWVTDGTDFSWIDDPAIRNWFLSRVNWEQKSKINSYHDKNNQQVIWYYPANGSGEPNEGVGYDYAKNVWTIYNQGRTVSHEASILRYPTSGDSNGYVFYDGIGKNANGQPLGCFVESARLSLGPPENFKEVLELRTGVHNLTGSFSVAISGYKNLSQTSSYGVGYAFDNSFNKINVREMGRFISLMYRSTATDSDFIITNVRLHGDIKGTD